MIVISISVSRGTPRPAVRQRAITTYSKYRAAPDFAVIHKEDGDVFLDVDSPVSMNMWGITPEFFEILKTGFDEFLEKTESTDLKAEYLLPTMIGDLLSDGKLEVKVLQSHDQWFGVSYKEDKESVTAALRGLIEKGVYPSKLF